MQSRRKPCNNWAGYIASRRNALTGDFTVIVNAAEHGIDSSGGKYAVICNAHGTILNVPSIPKARPFMKDPQFCEECEQLQKKVHQFTTERGSNMDMYALATPKLQQEAYQNGYKEGRLARKGITFPSSYLLHSVGDFPPGSWSSQSARGYSDGFYGRTESCVVIQPERQGAAETQL